VFLADWKNGRVHEIDDAGATSKLFIDYATSGLSPVSFQFVREATRLAPVFEPFQNKFNRLLVFGADASLNYELRDVSSYRLMPKPSAPNPIPPGRFRIDVAEGPANGFGVFFLGVPPRAGGTQDSYFAIPGFEFPFFWAIEFLRPWFAAPVNLTGAGMGTLALENPGGVAALDVQVFLLDARGIAVGTSSFVTLGFARR
jgi:hypothetical protein